ncbi:MAG: hypothetical protein N2654_05050 [Deltaproteobacteria bacterium]|nr:hypothetical protein [Deltaproteobacteria bacterium]
MKRIFCFFIAILVIGCASQFNPREAQASTSVPVASQVRELVIPYDPNIPRFVVQVQPVNFRVANVSGTTVIDGKVQNINVDVNTVTQFGDVISAQLESALSNVGNLVLYDSTTKNPPVGKGEKGPYLISATITEFNEVADAESGGVGGSLGAAGLIAGIAGAYADKPGLMWGGAAVAAANPTFVDAKARRTGMVAMDVKIVEKKTGRIIRSFPARGTFTAVTHVNGFSVFGIGKQETRVAQSALGQALRVALNEAAEQVFDTLAMRG